MKRNYHVPKNSLVKRNVNRLKIVKNIHAIVRYIQILIHEKLIFYFFFCCSTNSVVIKIVHLVIRYVVNHYPVANINVNRFVIKVHAIRVNSNHKSIVDVVKPRNLFRAVGKGLEWYAWNPAGTYFEHHKKQ